MAITVFKKDTNLFYVNVVWLSAWLLLFNSNILAATPLAAVYDVLIYLYLAFAVFFGMAYFFDKFFVKKKLAKMDIVVVLLFLAPVYMAFQANRVWDQSMMKGMYIAFFNVALFGGLFIYYLLRIRAITIHQYNFASLCVCWMSLILYVVMMYTLNPMLYQESGLVGYNASKGGYVWRFSSSYLSYGIFYYFADFSLNKRKRSLLLFLVILSYIVFVDKGRILLVTTVAVMFFFMITTLPFKTLIRRAGTLFVIIGAGLGMIYLVYPEVITMLVKMFQVFFLALIGVQTGEGSADSRWIQIAHVLDHFNKYPIDVIFGTGKLAGGYEDLFGHFYLSDIGIFGILFVVGIIGTIYHYAFYAYAVWLARSVKTYKYDLIFNTAKMALMFSFLSSFFTGGFVWTPLAILNILSLIHIYKLKEMTLDYNETKELPDV